MPDKPPKPPSQGDQFRKRADQMGRSLKHRTGPDRAKMEKKKRALEDMANNEDWLNGKPGSQVKK